MMLIARSFCRAHRLYTFYAFTFMSAFVAFYLISGGNELPITWVPFFKVPSCYHQKPNFHYTHSATEILNARKEIFTGIHESRIHHDSVWNPLPFAPHPLSDWNEMCLKLKWNTSHAATVGPCFASIPGVKSIHYLSSWPVPWPPLQLHAAQQLLWTVWVCHSSQMILSFCLKLVLITKAWF